MLRFGFFVFRFDFVVQIHRVVSLLFFLLRYLLLAIRFLGISLLAFRLLGISLLAFCFFVFRLLGISFIGISLLDISLLGFALGPSTFRYSLRVVTGFCLSPLVVSTSGISFLSSGGGRLLPVATRRTDTFRFSLRVVAGFCLSPLVVPTSDFFSVFRFPATACNTDGARGDPVHQS